MSTPRDQVQTIINHARDLRKRAWSYYRQVEEYRQAVYDREYIKQEHAKTNGNKLAAQLLGDTVLFNLHVDTVCSGAREWQTLVSQQQFYERLANLELTAAHTEMYAYDNGWE